MKKLKMLVKASPKSSKKAKRAAAEAIAEAEAAEAATDAAFAAAATASAEPPAAAAATAFDDEERPYKLLAEFQSSNAPMSARLVGELLSVPEQIVTSTDLELSTFFDFGSGEPIGLGQSSVVRAARKKVEGQRVAVKCLDLDAQSESALNLEMARTEVKALRSIKPHPHIVRLLMISCSPRELALTFELHDLDLLAHIEECGGGLAEPQARLIGAQLASALRHMHAAGWAHRDVKPENICLVRRVQVRRPQPRPQP